MVILTARDDAGHVIRQEHPTIAAACQAADTHMQDGFADSRMEEQHD